MPDVTVRELAATLARAVSSWRALGRENNWAPLPSAVPHWRDARVDDLCRTLTEADAAAGLLVQSALEHGDLAARAMSKELAVAPSTLARTATEHALRALASLDGDISPQERAARRLNDELVAIDEDQWAYDGAVYSGLPIVGAERVDYAKNVNRVKERADRSGLTFHAGTRHADGPRRRGRHPFVGGSPRRDSMTLAETYLAGETKGYPNVLMRRHGAMEHGHEIGILDSARQVPGPHEVNIFILQQPSASELANTLLLMPFAVSNAARQLARHYQWPATPIARKAQNEDARLLDIWQRAACQE